MKTGGVLLIVLLIGLMIVMGFFYLAVGTQNAQDVRDGGDAQTITMVQPQGTPETDYLNSKTNLNNSESTLNLASADNATTRTNAEAVATYANVFISVLVVVVIIIVFAGAFMMYKAG